MKIQKKLSKKSLIIAIAAATTLVAAGLIWYLASSRQNFEDTSNTATRQDKVEGQRKSSSDTTPEPAPSATDKSVSHEKEKELPQLYEGENTNASTGLTGAINSKSISGDYLVIRNTINQFVDSGTCELTLRSGNKTVNRSVEIIQNPSSSSCAGFDIPVSELSPGQWNLEIKVSSENKQMILTEVVNL